MIPPGESCHCQTLTEEASSNLRKYKTRAVAQGTRLAGCIYTIRCVLFTTLSMIFRHERGDSKSIAELEDSTDLFQSTQ